MDHYWTDSTRELTGVRLLDWIAEKTESGRIPPVEQFADESGADPGTVVALVDEFEDLGYVAVNRSLGNTASAHLVGRGRAFVDGRRERRRNRRLRGIANREALLDWIYSAEVTWPDGTVGEIGSVDQFEGDVRAHFEGDPFSLDEIQGAAKHLADEGHIRGVAAWGASLLRPEVTSTGTTIVEHYDGSLSQYERRNQVSGTSYSNNFHNSPVYGQVGAGASVSQTQSNSGGPVADLAALISAVRAEAAGLDVEPRVSNLLGTIEDAAQDDEPDVAFLESAGKSLAKVSEKAGNAALNTAVGALVNGLVRLFPEWLQS